LMSCMAEVFLSSCAAAAGRARPTPNAGCSGKVVPDSKVGEYWIARARGR
jgi:hypothetical protein